MKGRISIFLGSVLLFSLFIGGCLQEEVQYRELSIPPPEFLIGPEDVLVVTVWRNQDLSKEVIVRPDGKISLPLLGDIVASGKDGSGAFKTSRRCARGIYVYTKRVGSSQRDQ